LALVTPFFNPITLQNPQEIGKVKKSWKFYPKLKEPIRNGRIRILKLRRMGQPPKVIGLPTPSPQNLKP